VTPGGQFHPIDEIPERDFLDGSLKPLMGAYIFEKIKIKIKIAQVFIWAAR
jgi:hypothetical protein